MWMRRQSDASGQAGPGGRQAATSSRPRPYYNSPRRIERIEARRSEKEGIQKTLLASRRARPERGDGGWGRGIERTREWSPRLATRCAWPTLLLLLLFRAVVPLIHTVTAGQRRAAGTTWPPVSIGKQNKTTGEKFELFCLL